MAVGSSKRAQQARHGGRIKAMPLFHGKATQDHGANSRSLLRRLPSFVQQPSAPGLIIAQRGA